LDEPGRRLAAVSWLEHLLRCAAAYGGTHDPGWFSSGQFD
jgi:hypothetical protein